jgi:hypothetical protein
MNTTKKKPNRPPNINKINYRKVQQGLVPISEEDEKLHDLIKNGDMFIGGFKKVRNYEHHKKGFKFLYAVFDFQNKFRLWEFERFRKRMLFYAGAFDEDIVDDTVIVSIWSMSFHEMDEYLFTWLFSAMKNAALEHFCWGSPEQQSRQADIILSFD